MKTEGFLGRRSNFLKNTATSSSLGELGQCELPAELPPLSTPACQLAARFGPGVTAGVSPGMVGCCLHPGFGRLCPSSPHSLMKAMEQWVEASVAETCSGMAETTKQMIQEIIIRGRLNSYSRDLLKEIHRLQEIT